MELVGTFILAYRILSLTAFPVESKTSEVSRMFTNWFSESTSTKKNLAQKALSPQSGYNTPSHPCCFVYLEPVATRLVLTTPLLYGLH
jgi:hypothetical protein